MQAKIIDPSLSSAFVCTQANQSVVSANSDQALATLSLCSIESDAIFSDFLHFQVGSVDFELVVVKHVWGIFKSEAPYLAKFKEICSLPFHNQMLKSAMGPMCILVTMG